jgi:hypothetical protein
MAGAGYYAGPAFGEKLHQGYISTLDAPTNALSFIGTITSALCLLLLPALSIRGSVAPVVAFMGYLGFVVLTSTWSVVFWESLYNAFKIFVYISATITVVNSLTIDRLYWTFFSSLICVGGVSAFLSLTDPTFAFSLDTDGWRGLFVHKNSLGAYLTYMIVLLFPHALLRQDHAVRASCCIAVALAIILLYYAQSKTGLIAALAYITLTTLMNRYGAGGRKRLLIWGSVVGVILIAAILPVMVDRIATGSITFTTRTVNWAFLINEFADHPFGLGGYTIPLDSSYMQHISRAGFSTSIDDSFIIILVNLGFAGVLVYCSLVFMILKHYYKLSNRYSFFGVGGVLVFLAYAVTESSSVFGYSIGTCTLFGQIVLAARSGAKRRPLDRQHNSRVVVWPQLDAGD